MSADVLPGSAGPFTRAVTYTWDTNRRYSPIIARVQTLGLTDEAPDDWVPWIIYDLGLEDVIPYVRTFRRVLAEGPAWQARRGTPDGISIGIGWVDSEGVVAPPDGRHNWWEFQVAFTAPAQSIEQLRQLVGIINLSKASEDELFRMYSPDYDLRPVRMDQHRFDQNGIFDDYSGAPRWDDGPYISFGSDKSTVLDFELELDGGTTVIVSRAVDWFDGYTWDRDVHGARPIRLWDASLEVETTGVHLDYEDTWSEARWDDRPWGMTEGPLLFGSLVTYDTGSPEVTYTDDTWHDDWVAESWNESVGSKPIRTGVETA